MNPQRYSLGAIVLHWLIAAALVFQIVFAESLEGPSGPDVFARFQLHKSVGITILVLSVIRLAWRFIAPRPAPLPGPGWATMLSRAVHAGFYIFMIAAPVTGWIMVSSSRIKIETLVFGVVPWPDLPVAQWMGGPAGVLHHYMPNIAIALFVLHVIGALRHQYILGHPILARMLPGGHGKAVGAVLLAATIIGGSFVLGKVADPKGVRTQPVTALEPTKVVDAPIATDTAVQVEPVAEDVASEDGVDAKPRKWVVSPGGKLGFTANWNGEAISGSFSKWTAAINFSPDALETSAIDVSIDLASVSTGDSQRDGSLTGSDFFDTTNFARATYRASSFKALGGDRYRADGTLTLRGRARPVPLTFTLTIDGDRATARGTTTVDRTNFGVGQGEYASTDEIAAPVAIAFDFRAATRD